MDKKDLAIQFLDTIVEKKLKFNIYIEDRLYGTYDDSSGQRHCTLEYYGYGSPDKDRYKGVYKVRRGLSFTNKEDEGKEGAVLGIINLNQLSDKAIIKICNDSITLGSIWISCYKNVID